jgi:hypothetical protein
VESWHDLGDSGRRAGGDWYFPDGQAGTVAATRQLEPVGRGPIADAEFVRLLTHRLGEMAERARERMDRLGQLDAASQDAVIEVVRAREEQLSGLPARAVPHHDLLEAEIAELAPRSRRSCWQSPASGR